MESVKMGTPPSRSAVGATEADFFTRKHELYAQREKRLQSLRRSFSLSSVIERLLGSTNEGGDNSTAIAVVLFVCNALHPNIDHEVLIFMEQILCTENHWDDGASTKVLVTSCDELVCSLLWLRQTGKFENVTLIALGHYLALLETAPPVYSFVASTKNDADFFASILSTHSVISKFWVLGCVTARAKENADYSKTIFGGRSPKREERTALRKVSVCGVDDIDATLRFVGVATDILAKSSLLCAVAAQIDHQQRIRPLWLVGEMQQTIPLLLSELPLGPIALVASTNCSEIQVEPYAPYAHPALLAQHHAALRSDHEHLYSRQIEWMWHPDFKFGIPLDAATGERLFDSEHSSSEAGTTATAGGIAQEILRGLELGSLPDMNELDEAAGEPRLASAISRYLKLCIPHHAHRDERPSF